MSFRPTHCPYPSCPASSGAPRHFIGKGSFARRVDGRRVQRYRCPECSRSFSTQTFRLDFRLRRPSLNTELFRLFISKVTLRQCARVAGCSRDTVRHRLDLLGNHCRQFHYQRLDAAVARGGLELSCQLDELETFEHNRRLKPLTMPVLIASPSFFLVHFAVGDLPARGGLRPADEQRKLEHEAVEGKRKSGSREAVALCWDVLARVQCPQQRVRVATDLKSQYAAQLEKRFGERLIHDRESGLAPRVSGSLLFPINHTFALMRDGLSRLVRRNWATTKKKAKLALHQWVWVAWRNYVRGKTNGMPDKTPAMLVGAAPSKLAVADLLRWSIRPPHAAATQ